ncbi:MAG: hypothetical protein AUG09_05915 [Acidobacteria bacterium 13_1_20CM_2_68_7]|nr:MAG: hypothetical protein AUG09_05915 [Acidobacteria bacterium 13_1_20CM_2_68_7]
MRISHPLLALLLTATLPVASVAAEQARNQKSTAPVTVGDFAVMLAKVSGNGRAVEIKSAADALRKSGVPLGDPKATLSEEKLAEILGHYGVKVTTSSPQQTVSRAKAEQALLLIGSSLTSSSVAASGTTPTPSDMADCLALSNHGQCEVCCKDLGGIATTCSKFCFEINKGSPGEPIP